MAEYIVEIRGLHPLGQIQNQITGEEAAFSRFERSSVGSHEGRFSNLATFAELEIGVMPPIPSLIIGTPSSVPAGRTLAWAGVMLVEDKLENVILLR